MTSERSSDTEVFAGPVATIVAPVLLEKAVTATLNGWLNPFCSTIRKKASTKIPQNHFIFQTPRKCFTPFISVRRHRAPARPRKLIRSPPQVLSGRVRTRVALVTPGAQEGEQPAGYAFPASDLVD